MRQTLLLLVAFTASHFVSAQNLPVAKPADAKMKIFVDALMKKNDHGRKDRPVEFTWQR